MISEQVVKLKSDIESVFSKDLWLDFEVLNYSPLDDGVLVIAASRDFSYYHNMEIRFVGVNFFCGAFSWKSSPIKSGLVVSCHSDEELMPPLPNDCPVVGVRFIGDDSSSVLVFASDVTVNFDTVFYYKRTPLGANERLAEWVNGS